VAVRPLPSDAPPRVARRHRARARARALAVVLALAGLACVTVGLRADPAPASAPAPRIARQSAPTPLLSARRVPAIFSSAVATDRLRMQLATLVSPADACVAVNDRSTALVRINADRPLAGASTQKLLVAAAALSVLQPASHFTTRVVSTGSLDGGTLAGDLVVVGGGDPVLTTSPDPGPAATPLSGLADAIVRAGITRIDGALVADDSRYDRERAIADWTPTEIAEGAHGALGALIVNGGYSDGAPATDPALDTAEALADLLAERDVEIAGGVSHADEQIAGAEEIAHVDSPPLSAIVEEMLLESNNETAELLTRELGFKRSGEGTTATGTEAVRIALARLGVPIAGVDLRDGSGLAPTDRVTCDALLRVVELSTRPLLTAIDTGLPIAGRTGTLALRFGGTSLVDRLRAKTGHIAGVVGLAGAIDHEDGRTGPRFAFVANGTFSTDEGTQLQDEIAAAIGAYPDAPAPAELVPAPQPSA
jgi:serine-type D-Ala-D-Ala carboxypeptidase/endopeptidase (penicillin-binding protein 4)